MLKELFLSILIGAIVLIGVNFVGQYFDFNIPINIWTVFIVGLLRIPGFILLLIIILL